MGLNVCVEVRVYLSGFGLLSEGGGGSWTSGLEV